MDFAIDTSNTASWTYEGKMTRHCWFCLQSSVCWFPWCNFIMVFSSCSLHTPFSTLPDPWWLIRFTFLKGSTVLFVCLLFHNRNTLKQDSDNSTHIRMKNRMIDNYIETHGEVEGDLTTNPLKKWLRCVRYQPIETYSEKQIGKCPCILSQASKKKVSRF